MISEQITKTAITKLRANHDILEVLDTQVRWCDFDFNLAVQEIAEVKITARYAIQNTSLVHTYYITIKDGDPIL